MGSLWEEAVRLVGRVASGGSRENPGLPPHVYRASIMIGEELASAGGLCPFCGRSLETPRGYYLHLVKVHGDEISLAVRSLAERIASESRHLAS